MRAITSGSRQIVLVAINTSIGYGVGAASLGEFGDVSNGDKEDSPFFLTS